MLNLDAEAHETECHYMSVHTTMRGFSSLTGTCISGDLKIKKIKVTCIFPILGRDHLIFMEVAA